MKALWLDKILFIIFFDTKQQNIVIFSDAGKFYKFLLRDAAYDTNKIIKIIITAVRDKSCLIIRPFIHSQSLSLKLL